MSERIIEMSLSREMKDSYLSYAMSVIVSRALPDVRDGLKPSQRRVLYTMRELGLTPTGSHRKCAKVVGECMGRFHPHGDSAIYYTLVRMAQNWNLRYTLADGQGNFGSIAPDRPAAMRYTEVRSTRMMMEMVADINEDTVDYGPNFDDSDTEPLVLPARAPQLLLNGSQGIAVGMATNIPPHNLHEICDALMVLIEWPDSAVEDLVGVVQGPDFPTGGQILGRSGIMKAYKTGRGKLTVRGKIQTETLKGGIEQIVITELPYQVTVQHLFSKIKDGLKGGRLEGISEINDETDKAGLRIVVRVKRGHDPDIVANQLFKMTPLQTTFGCNMLALENNRPKVMNLKHMLRAFLNHRIDVIRRRTSFRLRKAEERIHLVEGYLKALDFIDEVIKIIRASQTPDEAKEQLMARFDLSQRQADAILLMRLQTLTGLERQKLLDEHADLSAKIADFKDILSREARVLDIIKEDLQDLKSKYGDARRTIITDEDPSEIDDLDLVPDDNVVVTVSREGYIKALPPSTYKSQNRGGKGVIGAQTKAGDILSEVFMATKHQLLMCFTNFGKVHWLYVYKIPEGSRQSKGRSIVNLLVGLEPDEKVKAVLPVTSFDTDNGLLLATRKGVAARNPLVAYKNVRKTGIKAIRLDEDDELIQARMTEGGDEFVFTTRGGYAARVDEEMFRMTGRGTRGVQAIRLREDDYVVEVVVRKPEKTLMTICEYGYGKRTNFDDYRKTNRNAMGVINIKTSERNGPVAAVLSVGEEDDILVIAAGGKVIRTRAAEIPLIGRVTQGVKIMNLDGEDRVVGLARIDDEEDEEDGENPTEARSAQDELDDALLEGFGEADETGQPFDEEEE